MKPALVLTLLLASAALGSEALDARQDRLSDQLRKAIVLEEADQNVEKAIQAYQAIVAQFDEVRKTAATALHRLAECYRKTGKREQAVAAYQRVAREFADQAALVESSRRQLAETYGVRESRADRESAELVRLRREMADAEQALQAARAREAEREARPSRSESSPSAEPVTLRMAELELAQIEVRLTEMRTKVQAGVVPPEALRQVEIEMAMAKERLQQALVERQAHEQQVREAQQLNQRMLKSVEAEIALIEEHIKAMENKIAKGLASPQEPELLRLRRDLLALQRRADELRIGIKR